MVDVDVEIDVGVGSTFMRLDVCEVVPLEFCFREERFLFLFVV